MDLVVVAIIGFFGNLVAVIGAAYLNQRGLRKAQKAAATASADAALAQIATANAARDASNAARALVDAAKETDARLEWLQHSADKNMEMAVGTHDIVNSQRTQMEKKIEVTTKTIIDLEKKIEVMQETITDLATKLQISQRN